MNNLHMLFHLCYYIFLLLYLYNILQLKNHLFLLQKIEYLIKDLFHQCHL